MKKNNPVGIISGILSVALIPMLLVACSPATSSPQATSPSQPQASNTPDPCAPQNVTATVTDLDKLTRQFDDSIQIAANTPGDQLVPIITQLQAIRRSTEDFTAPGCMDNLKSLQLNYMNTYINTLLALYNNYADMATAKPYIGIATAYAGTATPPVAVKNYLALFDQDAGMINQGINQANAYHNQYEAEKARLEGVTLTPTPVQLVPASTPAAATPTP